MASADAARRYYRRTGDYCRHANEAERLAQRVEIWGVELENGQRVSVASEAQAQAFARQAEARQCVFIAVNRR
jgi:hypothetical protein